MLTFQPDAQSAKNMTYDEKGNLLSLTNSCGTTNYTWDARNRLVGINGFNTDCSALSASFKYDALGRRIERTVNGRTIQYLYDGLDIVQEIENSAVYANYIRTLNIDEPLARVKADGTVRYYQQDALGSVIALTDGVGAIKTQYTYDPFGGATITGETSDNPFQYTGRENDGTGLYYYRARYYSPELHRFISEDPIGLGGGINVYAYVGNSPIIRIDPLGLYGTNDCSYYEQRCLESGGKYYCETVQYYCNKFPKYPDPDPSRDDDFEGWSRCTRQCLQDCDREQNKDQNYCPREPDPTTDEFTDRKHTYCHVKCYVECGAQKVRHPLTP